MDQNRQEAIRWLSQAEIDIKSALWMKEGKFFADACFKAQQAAEKALKAVLYFSGKRHVYGHSTLSLLKSVEQVYSEAHELEPACRKLDKLYVISRYPNGLPDGIPHDYFDETEAQEAINNADAIILFGKRVLGK